MRPLDRYRDPTRVHQLLAELSQSLRRPWTVMEVCGGQTHALLANGLDQMLPQGLRLVHGPGCPVCVTPVEAIDFALNLATRPEVILCSFGDMLRVPGSANDLLRIRSMGGDVRTVYSPLDGVRIAVENPCSQVVFFAVGFETTVPATALAVLRARSLKLTNFTLLTAHVRVPPAIEAILSDPDSAVQGFLAAGHVCAIMGEAEYRQLSQRYRIPIVITGFEPVDLLEGLLRVIRLLERGHYDVENQYARVVREEGNLAARQLINKVFEVQDQRWRGLGLLRHGGYRLREEYAQFDAWQRFSSEVKPLAEAEMLCRAGEVLTGRLRPSDCPHFGQRCRPEHPLGAPMVSAEGACAAYWKSGRRASSSIVTL